MKILANELNFHSNIYALSARIRLRGGDPDEDLVLVKSRDGRINARDIIDAMTDEVALALLPNVYYRSGQFIDM